MAAQEWQQPVRQQAAPLYPYNSAAPQGVPGSLTHRDGAEDALVEDDGEHQEGHGGDADDEPDEEGCKGRGELRVDEWDGMGRHAQSDQLRAGQFAALRSSRAHRNQESSTPLPFRRTYTGVPAPACPEGEGPALRLAARRRRRPAQQGHEQCTCVAVRRTGG